MSWQTIFLIIFAVTGYYFTVAVYVLGVQMHLSVPRMTSKFIITDQQNWKMAALQFVLAVLLPFWAGQSGMLTIVFTALSLSVLSFIVMEVFSLVSPSSIIFQVSGLLAPVFVPGLVGYIIAVVVLVASIDSKESVAYNGRFCRYIIRLHSRCQKKFSSHFVTETKFIADVAMSILLVEILCRPLLFRIFEIIAKKTIYRSIPMSTGIMQVISDTALSDDESIRLGVDYIKRLDKQYKKQGVHDEYKRVKKIASAYNGDDEYAEYLLPLYCYVRDGSFPQ